MPSWNQAARRGIVSGSVASLVSTAALAASGALERGHPAAPTNATSHWVWGKSALRANRPSVRHTLVGYAIHHACSVFWATLYEKAAGDGNGERLPRTAGAAAAVAAAAFAIDTFATPRRLKPGFEARLSRGSLFAVYSLFAAGLAAGAVAARHLQDARRARAEGRKPAQMPDGPRVNPADPVEEASYESFPASDPPSFSGSIAAPRSGNGRDRSH